MAKKIIKYYCTAAILTQREGEPAPTHPLLQLSSLEPTVLPYCKYDPDDKEGIKKYFQSYIDSINNEWILNNKEE